MFDNEWFCIIKDDRYLNLEQHFISFKRCDTVNGIYMYTSSNDFKTIILSEILNIYVSWFMSE